MEEIDEILTERVNEERSDPKRRESQEAELNSRTKDQ